MCDYSLHGVKTRDAAVDDVLTTRLFNNHTTGFACAKEYDTAVCLRPGTELAIDDPVRVRRTGLMALVAVLLPFMDFEKRRGGVAKFRQINLNRAHQHHDALELPDGSVVLLTRLAEGQRARVLQLPREEKPSTSSSDIQLRASERV